MSKKEGQKFIGDFRYYRPLLADGTISNLGGAVIAFTEKDGRVFAAVSFAHPNDNFSFQYGRNKANGRLAQLLSKPELDDEDIYFVRESNLGDFFRVFDAYMADDLEYFRNGKEGPQREEQAAQA